MQKVRVDKWLWSVRIFKTRTIASKACKNNRVKIDAHPIKPAYLLEQGQIIQVYKESFNLTFKVVKLINKRVSATLAQVCYENLTPNDELNKFKNWFIGKGRPEMRAKGAGRPTKKERRTIEEFKETIFEELLDFEE